MTSENIEPNEQLVNEAAKGDRASLMRLATWHRERGRPNDGFTEDSDEQIAYWLEAYSFEIQERQQQARKLRRLLSLLPQTLPTFAVTRHARLQDLRDTASAFGLPVTIHAAQWVISSGAEVDQLDAERPAERSFLRGGNITDQNVHFYLVICPTDGQSEAETTERMQTFFAQHFSGLMSIEMRHWNDPLTEAGEEAAVQLGLRD